MWPLLLVILAAAALPPDQVGRPVRMADLRTLRLSARRDVYCHRSCGPEIRHVLDDRAPIRSAVCTAAEGTGPAR